MFSEPFDFSDAEEKFGFLRPIMPRELVFAPILLVTHTHTHRERERERERETDRQTDRQTESREPAGMPKKIRFFYLMVDEYGYFLIFDISSTVYRDYKTANNLLFS